MTFSIKNRTAFITERKEILLHNYRKESSANKTWVRPKIFYSNTLVKSAFEEVIPLWHAESRVNWGRAALMWQVTSLETLEVCPAKISLEPPLGVIPEQGATLKKISGTKTAPFGSRLAVRFSSLFLSEALFGTKEQGASRKIGKGAGSRQA